MKNFLLICCAAILTVTLMACGSSEPAKTGLQIAGAGEVPIWFLNPPADNDNALFVAKTSTSQDLQLSINKAEQECRAAMALKLEAKVSALIKKFDEETGTGQNTELLGQFTQVSKAVASQEINGLKSKETKIAKDGDIWRAYVLMEAPLGTANKILVQKIKANEAVRTELKASKSFQELDKAVGDGQ